jgi:hypothetical protein
MTKIGIGFQLSASAAGMSQGINAGVVELQKLGYQAKRTADDVRVLKTLEIGRAFLNGISLVATTFQRFTSGASSAIDQTNKLSRALGISFEELQQLQLAADLSGASSEQLANAFTRAQVTITKAASGGVEATRALRSLGLSVSELAGLSSSQQFERIATAIAAIQNPAQRAAAAVAIFGRSGAQLLPTFQELGSNLQRAEAFFGGFQQRLSTNDASNVEAVNDAFTEVGKAVQEVAGLVISRLSPALLRGSESLRTFIQSVNIDDVARRAGSALEQFARAAEVLANIVSAGLQRPLFAAGAALAFINRQAIASGVVGLGRAFAAAASAAVGLATSSTVAAASLVALRASITGLLTATGVGAAVVVFGLLTEAAVNFATRGTDAAVNVEAEVQKVSAAVKKAQADFGGLGEAAVQAGAKAKAALTVPNVSFVSLAQDAVGEAASAVAGLAKELGGLDRVPAEILTQFSEIQFLVQDANVDLVNQQQIAGEILTLSQRLTGALKEQTDARNRDTEAARKANDEARRAAEEIRNRTLQIAESGLSGADQSRLQLARELAVIDQERLNAERALGQARASNDAAGIRDAQLRLRIAGAARSAAEEQDRGRQLQAIGLDQNLLRPARTISDEFQKVRDAFEKKLINPDEARNALRNLAQEGIDIRREIDQELSRPSAEALRVSDIRSGEGIAQFFATSRRDPAADQRSQQIAKLEEIRAALIAVGDRPVDILGAA